MSSKRPRPRNDAEVKDELNNLEIEDFAPRGFPNRATELTEPRSLSERVSRRPSLAELDGDKE